MLQMYPVGVLFGFGFDTASSIALLAIAAVAKRNGASDGDASSHTGIIPSSYVVILPVSLGLRLSICSWNFIQSVLT